MATLEPVQTDCTGSAAQHHTDSASTGGVLMGSAASPAKGNTPWLRPRNHKTGGLALPEPQEAENKWDPEQFSDVLGPHLAVRNNVAGQPARTGQTAQRD